MKSTRIGTTLTLFLSSSLFAQEVIHIPRVPPTYMQLLLQPKFISMLVLGILALVLLRTRRMREGFRMTFLILATLLFGIIGNLPGHFFQGFAMHPSPICAVTKPFLMGLRLPFVVTISVILILTVLGPKLFCSYVCPVGASQELMDKLGKRMGLKKVRMNFNITSAIRLFMFVIFIALSASFFLHVIVMGKTYAVSTFDSINPFHGFEFKFDGKPLGILVYYLPLILTLVAAVKTYRPFCHLVCPVGFFTHWIEQLGMHRLTFVPEKCTDCRICITETVCPTVPEILKQAELRPDCFACNQCVTACPEGALKWHYVRTEQSRTS